MSHKEVDRLESTSITGCTIELVTAMRNWGSRSLRPLRNLGNYLEDCSSLQAEVGEASALTELRTIPGDCNSLYF